MRVHHFRLIYGPVCTWIINGTRNCNVTLISKSMDMHSSVQCSAPGQMNSNVIVLLYCDWCIVPICELLSSTGPQQFRPSSPDLARILNIMATYLPSFYSRAVLLCVA